MARENRYAIGNLHNAETSIYESNLREGIAVEELAEDKLTDIQESNSEKRKNPLFTNSFIHTATMQRKADDNVDDDDENDDDIDLDDDDDLDVDEDLAVDDAEITDADIDEDFDEDELDDDLTLDDEEDDEEDDDVVR